MYTRTFKEMQFGYGSAMSVILMELCILISVVINTVFRRAEDNIE